MSELNADEEETYLSKSPRRQSHPGDNSTVFQFISVNPQSAQESRRNNQLAHSHLAKVNRHKRRTQESGVPAHKSRRRTAPTIPPHRTFPASALRSQYSADSSQHGGHWWDSTQTDLSGDVYSLDDCCSGQLLAQAGALINASDSGTASWDSRYVPDEETATDPFERFIQTSRNEAPSRTLSPVLGAMANFTLECSSQSILAQTIDTKINLTFPKYSKPFDISRLKLFYEQPIIFHGFTVASAVHRDVLRNKPCLSRNQEIIAHHGKLLHLLNELFGGLQDADLEVAILGILLLTLANLEWDKLQGDPILPFRPYMASANWINVFGRVMNVDEKRFDEHVRTMMTLVARLGGLEHLRLPGLGVQVA